MAKSIIPIPVLTVIMKAFWEKLGPVSPKKGKIKALAVTNLVFGVEKDLSEGQKYEYVIGGKTYTIYDGKYHKIVVGPDYNYYFSKRDGEFRRWGATYEDDPMYSPIGPEILDLEISINGCSGNCKFCYKNNTNEPATNMSFDTFKKIIDSLPKVLTQIAFGITGVQANPDFIKMMEYCREIGIVPNFTLSGIDLTDELAVKTSKLVGALAVSAYQTDKNICYDTVKKFVDLGIEQTNIHLLVSEESLDFVYEVLNDRMTDPRLTNMGAIVFLGVKPKGRAKDGYHSLSTAKYKELIEYCFGNNLSVGFDSCSAPKFEAVVRSMDSTKEEKEKLIGCSESCESSLLSAYINYKGEYWHCSFSENEPGIECINCLNYDNFLDAWYSDEIVRFRNKSIASVKDGCRYCQVFPLINA